MKIGDHVELINDNWDSFFHRGKRWIPDDMKYPVKGVVYTIRDIGPHVANMGDGLLLEEIHNQIHPATNRECCFDVRRFRKLELPPDLLTELEEVLTLQNV
jgi:hypothetical protein